MLHGGAEDRMHAFQHLAVSAPPRVNSRVAIVSHFKGSCQLPPPAGSVPDAPKAGRARKNCPAAVSSCHWAEYCYIGNEIIADVNNLTAFRLAVAAACGGGESSLKKRRIIPFPRIFTSEIGPARTIAQPLAALPLFPARGMRWLYAAKPQEPSGRMGRAPCGRNAAMRSPDR